MGYTIPIGPYHPALEEPVYAKLYTEGEIIKDAEVHIGYNHRGIEKLATQRNFIQTLALVERVCGICSHSHPLTYCLAIEAIAGMEAPKRGQYIRAITAELERLHSHFLWLGLAAHVIGFDSVFMFAFNAREKVMDALEALSGNRVNYGMNIIGGARRDIDSNQKSQDSEKLCKVERFVEKPNAEKAQEYLLDGNYLWNGGMFIWKCKTVLLLTEKYLNNTFNILQEIAVATEADYESVLFENYSKVEPISVDYGIMENAKDIYVIPSDFGWDDVGSWDAVERYIDKDENNNVHLGDVKSIGSSNNLVVCKTKPIITVGLDDIFIVETDDVILVSSKERLENINELLVKNNIKLRKKGL